MRTVLGRRRTVRRRRGGPRSRARPPAARVRGASIWRTRSRVSPSDSADLLERLRILAAQPVAKPQHLALPLGELLERAMKRLLGETDLDLGLDAVLLVAEEIADRRVALVAERLVEARHGAGRLPHLLQVLERDLRRLGDLLVGRRSSELRAQLAFRAADSGLALARCAPGSGSCATCSRRRVARPGESTTSHRSRT